MKTLVARMRTKLRAETRAAQGCIRARMAYLDGARTRQYGLEDNAQPGPRARTATRLMRLVLAVMRLTLVVMRLCGTTSVGEPPRCWRGGDRAVVCDLRTRLVQWVRNAAHSPDARAEGCRVLCMYILEDA